MRKFVQELLQYVKLISVSLVLKQMIAVLKEINVNWKLKILVF